MADRKADAKAGSATRRIKWLGGFVLVLIAGYTALWFFLAGRLESGVEDAIAGAAANGTTIECADRDVRGYPFRLGLFCERTVVQAPGAVVEAGAFRSAAQIYRPGLVISELDGPFELSAEGVTASGDWQQARASTRFGTEQLQLGTFRMDDASLTFDVAGGAPIGAALGSLTASVRPNGANLDLALDAFDFDAEPIAGRDAPPLDLSLDATLGDAAGAVAYAGEPIDTLRGRDVELRRLEIGLREGGRVVSEGAVSIDASGLASGEVTVSFTDLDATLETIATLVPEAASQIELIRPVLGQAGGGLLANALGGGKDADAPTAGTTRVTIALDRGRARVGILPIGYLPPLP